MKLKYTKFQVALEVIGLLSLLGMILYIAVNWSNIPDMIPGHYNSAGEIDRWGNKSEILVPPIISIIMYIGLSVVSLFPSIWNVPCEITERNRVPVYQCVKTMLIVLKIEFIFVFFYLCIHTATTKPLPSSFLFIYLGIIIGSLVFFIIRCCHLGKRYR